MLCCDRFAVWTGHLQLHHHRPAVPACSIQEAARWAGHSLRYQRSLSHASPQSPTAPWLPKLRLRRCFLPHFWNRAGHLRRDQTLPTQTQWWKHFSHTREQVSISLSQPIWTPLSVVRHLSLTFIKYLLINTVKNVRYPIANSIRCWSVVVFFPTSITRPVFLVLVYKIWAWCFVFQSIHTSTISFHAPWMLDKLMFQISWNKYMI